VDPAGLESANRPLCSYGVRSEAEGSSGVVGKTIEGDGNLGGSPLRCFALGLALGLVAAGSGQSRGQPYLRVVVITRGGNDVGNEMIDSWFQRLALLAGRNVGPANDAWPKHAC
jgi:hypothetical protein